MVNMQEQPAAENGNSPPQQPMFSVVVEVSPNIDIRTARFANAAGPDLRNDIQNAWRQYQEQSVRFQEMQGSILEDLAALRADLLQEAQRLRAEIFRQ